MTSSPTRQRRVLADIIRHMEEQVTTAVKNQPAGSSGENLPPQRLRGASTELQLMARIDRLLAELSPEAAKRIVAYFAQREFGGEWKLIPPEGAR